MLFRSKVENIEDGIVGVTKYDACIIGVPVKDTIKEVDSLGNVINTPDRNFIWAAQTPQCFWKDTLIKAYKKALEDEYVGTDDGMLVERLGVKVKMIKGSYENIKITTPEDLIVAESFVKDKDLFFRNKRFLFQSR